MKRKSLLLLLSIFIHFTSLAQSVEKEVMKTIHQEMMIDSILEKTWRIFYFNDSERKYHGYNNNIRIIDLTKKIELKNFFYKKVNVSIKKQIPLNLNNGAHRDVILNNYYHNNDTVNIDAFLCSFNPDYYLVRQPYLCNFKFYINRVGVSILRYQISELDDWDGYLENWLIK